MNEDWKPVMLEADSSFMLVDPSVEWEVGPADEGWESVILDLERNRPDGLCKVIGRMSIAG